MKKVIAISDSFKGTISSIETCEMIKKAFTRHFPDCQVVGIPVADGGEGTVECFLYAIGGEKVPVTVSGPYFEKIDSFYARIGDMAVIEMAAAAGLPMVEDRKNPGATTTYGVGEMIRHAAQSGCKEIILGLGGSCTNDGGAGCAAGAGVVFRNAKGEEFVPTGFTLGEIDSIDVSAAKELLKGCKITVMYDIDNPLWGPTGAAYVFGPQKGADPAMVEQLDQQLRAFDKAIQKSLGIDISTLPGGGAAGGMGAGMVALLGGQLKAGIETVLDAVDFDKVISDADLIITGEGKLDSQSLRGKVVVGIAGRAKRQQKPVVAVVGDVGDGIEKVYDTGVTAVFSINRVAVPFSEAKHRSKRDYAETMEDIARFAKALVK